MSAGCAPPDRTAGHRENHQWWRCSWRNPCEEWMCFTIPAIYISFVRKQDFYISNKSKTVNQYPKSIQIVTVRYHSDTDDANGDHYDDVVSCQHTADSRGKKAPPHQRNPRLMNAKTSCHPSACRHAGQPGTVWGARGHSRQSGRSASDEKSTQETKPGALSAAHQTSGVVTRPCRTTCTICGRASSPGPLR